VASVNKQSLREEFEALKGRFAQLCTDGKITAESRALFDALLILLQVLMAVFMDNAGTEIIPSVGERLAYFAMNARSSCS
jgi:hypothetical protein